VQNRYLIVLFYNPSRQNKKANLKDQEAALRAMQERHGVDGEQHARPKPGGDAGGGGSGGGGAQ
jgi:pre-mRNA branch site protein p14